MHYNFMKLSLRVWIINLFNNTGTVLATRFRRSNHFVISWSFAVQILSTLLSNSSRVAAFDLSFQFLLSWSEDSALNFGLFGSGSLGLLTSLFPEKHFSQPRVRCRCRGKKGVSMVHLYSGWCLTTHRSLNRREWCPLVMQSMMVDCCHTLCLRERNQSGRSSSVLRLQNTVLAWCCSRWSHSASVLCILIRIYIAQILILKVGSWTATSPILLTKHSTSFTVFSYSISFDEGCRYCLKLSCLLVTTSNLSSHSSVHLFQILS